MPDASSPRRPVAVVTGASRGIGRAVALELASDHDIVAVARSRDALEQLAAEIGASGSRCLVRPADLADPASIARALDGVAADVLVNNAGVGVLVPFLELAPEDWHRMVDVNVNALYHVTRALLPAMVERGRGHVITVSSIAGRSAFPGGSCYAATKHFANAFSESLYLEVREHGIKVSVVQPGATATHFNLGDPDAPGNAWKLRPEAVARAVRYLLSTGDNELVFQMEVRALRKR